jgi:uncharacterized LabA/DUF88 family protein
MPRQRPEEVDSPTEKVYAAVDVNNLWHSAKGVYGSQARVDFLDLLKRIKKGGFDKVPREVRAAAYTITAPHRTEGPDGTVRVKSSRNERFLGTLEKFGYEVHTRHMRFEKGIDKPFHTDWDVGIAVQVIELLPWFNTFVLASGDGDYGPLLKRVRDADKRVEIYTFRSVASPVLYEFANEVHYLDGEDVFQEKTIKVLG